MAGKQIGGDGGLPANLAGMTKSQLYDIMSQMKVLSSFFSILFRLSAITLSFTDLNREQLISSSFFRILFF